MLCQGSSKQAEHPAHQLIFWKCMNMWRTILRTSIMNLSSLSLSMPNHSRRMVSRQAAKKRCAICRCSQRDRQSRSLAPRVAGSTVPVHAEPLLHRVFSQDTWCCCTFASATWKAGHMQQFASHLRLQPVQDAGQPLSQVLLQQREYSLQT